MKRYLVLFILVGLVSCKDDSPTTSADNSSGYPTTIAKSNESEANAEFNFFESSLGTSIRGKVDTFGFVGHLGLLSRGRSSISDAAQAIMVAKLALLAVSSRTCVFDPSLIEVKSAHRYDSGPLSFSDWEIQFKSQTYKGLEVWNSEILVLVADDLIQLDGHWYKDVIIPADNTISKEQAKTALVGSVIQYYARGGPEVFTVVDSIIHLDSIKQSIYPLIKSDCLELRVVWKVPIGSWWYYFVDIVSGEKVALKQRFIS